MAVLNVPKSKFKPKAFEYLRRVQAGDRICITDHGQPVVDIQRHGCQDDDLLSDLRGMVIHYQDPCEPIGDDWEANT